MESERFAALSEIFTAKQWHFFTLTSYERNACFGLTLNDNSSDDVSIFVKIKLFPDGLENDLKHLSPPKPFWTIVRDRSHDEGQLLNLV